MKKLNCLAATVFGGSLLVGASANAMFVDFSDQTAFSALGTITTTEFVQSGISAPLENFSAGGVKYTNADYVIIGPNTSASGFSKSIFTNTYAGGQLSGDLQNSYSLFGFDLGYLGTAPTPKFGAPSPITISLTTSLDNILNTYSYSPLAMPAPNSLEFVGFEFTGGEILKSFVIQGSGGITPAINDIQVGTLSAVPLPGALPLFGAALVGLGGLARRRTSRRPA